MIGGGRGAHVAYSMDRAVRGPRETSPSPSRFAIGDFVKLSPIFTKYDGAVDGCAKGALRFGDSEIGEIVDYRANDICPCQVRSPSGVLWNYMDDALVLVSREALYVASRNFPADADTYVDAYRDRDRERDSEVARPAAVKIEVAGENTGSCATRTSKTCCIPDGFWAGLSIFLAFTDFLTDILFCNHVKNKDFKNLRAYFVASVAFIVIPMLGNLYRVWKMCKDEKVKSRFKHSYALLLPICKFTAASDTSNDRSCDGCNLRLQCSELYEGQYYYLGPLTAAYIWYRKSTSDIEISSAVNDIWCDKCGQRMLACFWPLYIVHWIIQSFFWFVLLVLLLVLFSLSLFEQLFYLSVVASNSELLYDKFGTKENRMKIVCVGILLEDIPQLIIQGIYSSHQFDHVPVVVLLSMIVTAWHIGYSIVFNYTLRDEDPLHVGEIIEITSLACSA